MWRYFTIRVLRPIPFQGCTGRPFAFYGFGLGAEAVYLGGGELNPFGQKDALLDAWLGA